MRSRKSKHQVRTEFENDPEKSSCPSKESSTSPVKALRNSETDIDEETGSESASDEPDSGSDEDFSPESGSESDEKAGNNTKDKLSVSASESENVSENVGPKTRRSESRKKNRQPVGKH